VRDEDGRAQESNNPPTHWRRMLSQRDANWDAVTLRQNGTKRVLSQTIPYGQDQIREDGWSSRARGSSRRITVLALIDLMQQSIPFFVTTLLAK
jgi:hypothetical protein